jgi:uncharacterized membrane protein YccC
MLARPDFSFSRAAVFNGLRLALAAWLAFAVAAMFHVENAYWAAMPVWVVIQPYRGLMLERGLFRILGTVIGASAGFAILWLAPDPYLDVALLGACVAVSAGLAQVLRGTPAYGAMMIGMSAAVVILPSVLNPAGGLGLALARTECTIIGVVVVTLVTGLFTPRVTEAAFLADVRRLTAEIVAFAVDTVATGTVDDGRVRALMHRFAEADGIAVAVSAGSIAGRRRLHQIDALMVAAFAVMAAAQTQSRRSLATRAGLGEPMRSIAALVNSGARSEAALRTVLAGVPATLAVALKSLFDAEAALHAPHSAAPAAGTLDRMAMLLAPHRRWTVANRNALLAAAATWIAGTLGLLAGRPEAELLALGVCIFAMVLGYLPDARKAAPMMFAGVLVGVAVATAYRFWVQPGIAGPADLLLTLAPFLVVGGLARTHPKTALPAIDANMCFLLGSQAGMPAAGAGEILLGAAALIAAATLVLGGVAALPRGGSPRRGRIARTVVADLRRLIDRPLPDLAMRRPVAHDLLRLALHLVREGELRGEIPRELLAALCLAQAIVALHERGAQEALDLLKDFDRDPRGVAARLAGLDRDVAATDAAASLAAAAVLFEKG